MGIELDAAQERVDHCEAIVDKAWAAVLADPADPAAVAAHERALNDLDQAGEELGDMEPWPDDDYDDDPWDPYYDD